MDLPVWVTETDNWPVHDLGALATADLGSLNYQKISNTFGQVGGKTTGQVANALGGVGTLFDDGLQFIADFANNVITGIANVINGIISAFSGLFGATGGINDAIGVMTASAETIAATSAAVQAMQNQTAADSNNGVNVWLDFSTYSNGTSITDFAQTVLTGSGTLGIASGRAVLQTSTANTRVFARYSAKPTNTDQQIVTAIYAVASTLTSSGGNVNVLICRSNSTMTTYVYYAFGWNGWSLHNVVSGVDTTLASGTYGTPTFYAGASYSLIADFQGGLPSYQLAVNGVGISGTLFVDSSAVTNTGASYRYCGFGGAFIGGAVSGKMAAFGFVDNAPAAIIGDIFEAQNNSATPANQANNSSMVLLPNSFYATVQVQTSNYTYAAATANKLTVTKPGIYAVKVAVQWVPHTSATYAYFGVGIFKNGLGYDFEQDCIISPGTLPFFMIKTATFYVPMAAGDYLQPGIISLSNSNSFLNRIVGGGDSTFYCALQNTGAAAA